MRYAIIIAFPDGRRNSQPSIVACGPAEKALCEASRFLTGAPEKTKLMIGHSDGPGWLNLSINTADMRAASVAEARARYSGGASGIQGRLRTARKLMDNYTNELDAIRVEAQQLQELREERAAVEAAALAPGGNVREASEKLQQLVGAGLLSEQRYNKLKTEFDRTSRSQINSIVDALRDLDACAEAAEWGWQEAANVERGAKLLAAIREWSPDAKLSDFAIREVLQGPSAPPVKYDLAADGAGNIEWNTAYLALHRAEKVAARLAEEEANGNGSKPAA